jgi:hypothetical protein
VSLYPNSVLVYCLLGQLKNVGGDCSGQAAPAVCAHMPCECALWPGWQVGVTSDSRMSFSYLHVLDMLVLLCCEEAGVQLQVRVL